MAARTASVVDDLTADAIDDLDQPVSAVAVDRLSVTDLEVAGGRAEQAVEDARLDLPSSCSC